MRCHMAKRKGAASPKAYLTRISCPRATAGCQHRTANEPACSQQRGLIHTISVGNHTDIPLSTLARSDVNDHEHPREESGKHGTFITQISTASRVAPLPLTKKATTSFPDTRHELF